MKKLGTSTGHCSSGNSSLFEAALASQFTEAITNIVRLVTEENLPFSIILQWLYSTSCLGLSDFSRELERQNIYILVIAYCAAHMMSMDDLKSLILGIYIKTPS